MQASNENPSFHSGKRGITRVVLLPQLFTMYKLESNVSDELMLAMLREDFYFFFLKTPTEITLVSDASSLCSGIAQEPGWRMFRVYDTLSFTEVGIISQISSVLANSYISLLLFSAFSTDYFCIKEEKLTEALRALQENGVPVHRI